MSLNNMSGLSAELYFLIAKFLSGGPCEKASEVLIGELEKHEIIPKSVNWLGETFTQDYKTFSSKFTHIGSEQLLRLLEHLLNSINSKELTSTSGTKSLLSSRTASLLQKSPSSSDRRFSIGQLLSRRNGHPLPPKTRNVVPPNFVSALVGRDLSGSGVGPDLLRPDFYSKLSLSCRTLSHLSAVYCVLFDITGKFIFTGADDKLVKVWSVSDGRLLATLRGSHQDSAEITDLAVNYENTLLAASSCDKVIRIWCLRTGAPISTLTGHGGTVTSIFFCPVPKSLSTMRYLGSTSTDGSCAFWAYTEEPGRQAVFQAKPTLYQERMRPGHAQMICASFSAGGVFMAAGSADFNVRVYYMLGLEGPERILEVEVHTDRVDSISWSHRGVRFISGSKDGIALVWRWEYQQWRYIKILCSNPSHGDPPIATDSKQRPRVTMVGWNADDTLVFTAISNNLVKVWNPLNGNLVRVLRDHCDEAYVVEAHPTNPRIVCTAAHDGNIFIWDIGTLSDPDQESGEKLFDYHNALPDGQGYGAIFDVKWSPDALCLAATDSHGNLMIFNCGDNSKFVGLPKELFFHTDYRPLIMDAITHTVLDEQTQVQPHLMPPPFLVDVDGNPYPPKLQRLVPGREGCQEEQLIPNVALAPTGFQEVIEGLAVFPGIVNPRSNIDQMIEQLAAAQGVRREDNAAHRRSGNRRSGDVEGVRQSTGNWQTTGFYRYFKRNVVPSLSRSLLARSEELRHAFANEEDQWYHEHKSRKAPTSASGLGLPVSPTGNFSSRLIKSRRLRRLAAQAAERRRQEELNERDEREGIARPNPPQQEISLPQERTMTPRRPPRSRPVAGTGRRRRVRYTIPRVSEHTRESELENGHTTGESDSEFSQHSDVSGSSSSESSESDWGVTPTGTPKKAVPVVNGKRRGARNQSNSPTEPKKEDSDEDYEEPKPGPSTQITKHIKTEPTVTPRPRRAKKRAVVEVGGLEEIDEKYRPSEWLSEVMPRRTPYYPQLGDDLIYFRQGHQMYVAEIQSQGIYSMSKKELKNLPWKLNPELDPELPVRVVGIKFELKPPRLMSLKLAVTHWKSGELTGVNINNVVYHDVPDVVDFLVLRQQYNKSMRHKWNVNDNFRCLIDKEWWLGSIQAKEPFTSQFPESKFMCYKANWDNKDEERMSPWDIEIIKDDFEIPKGGTKGDKGIPATEADLRSGMYEVNKRDWPPHGHQDAECIRIRTMLENIMELAIAEPFLTPVDLNSYPMYAYEVEYPIDLSTIKSRLENHFYRRLDAVKFDIKYIAQNAEKFNRPRSDIVKQGRIIRDICLNVMSQPGVTEVNSVYHTLMKNFTWSDSDGELHEKTARGKSKVAVLPHSTNTRNISLKLEPAHGTSSSANVRCSTRLRQKETTKLHRKGHRLGSDESSKSWQERCKDFLSTIWNSRDSGPFREPVDPIEYPDYHHQIDTPMDLQSVKEDLLGNNYATPQAFAKDMQLIFVNSRIYNTDKHSQICIMTIRLQALFECQMKQILDDHKYRRRATDSSKSQVHQRVSRRNEQTSSPQRNANNVASTSRTSRSSAPVNSDSRIGSANSTPRKNPRRSAAAKNPYLHNENSNNPYDSSSDPPADEDTYRDKRPRRKRQLSMQDRCASAAKKRREVNGQGTSASTMFTVTSPNRRQVKRLRILSGNSVEETPIKVEPTNSQSSSKAGSRRNSKSKAIIFSKKTLSVKSEEVESEENEFEDSDVQMPNLKKVESEYEESLSNDSDSEHTLEVQSRVSQRGGMCLRRRSNRNRIRSEEEDSSDAYKETPTKSKKNRLISEIPTRSSRRVMSLRKRSQIKARHVTDEEESDDAGPKTRYRGRAATNYDETGDLSDNSEQSESTLTLADRVKKSRRASSALTNGYNDPYDSD